MEFVLGTKDNAFSPHRIYMDKISVLSVLDVRQVRMVCELEGKLEVLVFTSISYLGPSRRVRAWQILSKFLSSCRCIKSLSFSPGMSPSTGPESFVESDEVAGSLP